MKFAHISDIHFDSPFVNLSDEDGLGEIRRLEQRKALKKSIEYVKENNIKYLFISGDLYEQKYIKKSTIEFINNLFKEIPNTKIFITPGNHDPFIKNSYYNTFNWNENVKIFNSKIERVECEDCNIYGFGFNDFTCKDSKIQDLEIDEKNKINILVIHGTLDGSATDGNNYNPISSKILEEKGFDYVALGHIHKSNFDKNNQKIVYPGSLVSLGFDELGEHGMIVGDIEKDKLNLEFIKIDETEFVLKEIDITEINSEEELIEKLNECEIKENNLAEIILVGRRNFEINKYEILKLIKNNKIIKIKNNTKINYDLNDLANDNTLKGLFAKKMLEKLNNKETTEEKRKIIEDAIEIGLDAF